MAICVNAVVGVAPCQCFSLGGNQTTSPGRISSIGPSQLCAQPRPNVTINVCPSGCVCQAVRAPGSNVTLAPRTRAGSGASNSGSIRTLPVNQSAGPLLKGCEPLLLISILSIPPCRSPANPGADNVHTQLCDSARHLLATPNNDQQLTNNCETCLAEHDLEKSGKFLDRIHRIKV